MKKLPKDDPTAIPLGIIGSACLLTAYGVSKGFTSYHLKMIHSHLKVLKSKALENDIIESNHLDLFAYSKSYQSEITKRAIARQASLKIAGMKSEGEVAIDRLNGQLQGELTIKSHLLKVSEIEKETAQNQLELSEISKKIDKISSKTTSDDDLKTSLIQALKDHEDGYLWSIINSLKPLWIIGNQGSGKTYTASAISLIRKYCLNADIFYLIDRHATGENAKVWSYLIPQNIAQNESEIKLAMQDCAMSWLHRIKEKPTAKNQIIVDEFTNLKTLIGDTADSFFKLSLTDTRKAKSYLLGITHNASNSSFPEGTSDTRKAGMTLIQKFSANGESPLSRVVVKYGLVDSAGNNLEDVEKSIPVWFHPVKIYSHFNGSPISF